MERRALGHPPASPLGSIEKGASLNENNPLPDSPGGPHGAPGVYLRAFPVRRTRRLLGEGTSPWGLFRKGLTSLPR